MDGVRAYALGSKDQPLYRSVIDFYSDREHGTRHNFVPKHWSQSARQHPLWLVYAASPFCFSAVGVYLLCALAARPERRLYDGEHLEGCMWIVAGLVSWACDVRDLGVPSLSHPVDRVSATGFTAFQLGKHAAYTLHGAYAGLPGWLCALFCVGLWFGFRCFQLSVLAVNERRLGGFLGWHSGWHVVWPAVQLLFLHGHYFGTWW